jgi:hypothetical protein
VHRSTKNYRRWKPVVAVLRKSLLKKLIKFFRLIFLLNRTIPFSITLITVDSKERENGLTPIRKPTV